MKKIFFSLIAFSSVILLMLSSCKKDETKAYSSIGSAGTLTSSTNTPALSKATGDNAAVTFTWPTTTVTGAGTITYTLQIDKKGNNFKLPREIAASGTSTAVTGDALNKVLLNLGFAENASAQVEVRLKSSIAANVDPAYSNVVTLTATPYSLVSYVYVPGGYQGWSPASAPTLASPTSNGVYDGTVTVAATVTDFGFKITPAPTWDLSYGGASGQLSTSGANLSFPAAGTYRLHVDLNTLTYTITKQ